MKTTIIYFLFLIPVATFGQSLLIDKETGKYTKQGVIDIQDFSKNDLHSKSIEWITMNYNSAKDVIQLNDAENGKIILKGAFSSNMYGKKGLIYHTLILQFKDNKFRYTYTDLSYYSSGSGEMVFEKSFMSKKKMIKKTEEKINASIINLSNFITTSYKTDDDW